MKPTKTNTISLKLSNACKYLQIKDVGAIAEKNKVTPRYVVMIIDRKRYNQQIERDLIIKARQRLDETRTETKTLTRELWDL
jgi:hypothetical protein